MNTNELAEKLLLMPQNIRNLQLIRYEIYKLLDLSFDLFFAKDIYNYTGSIYIFFGSYYSKEIKYPRNYHVNESELDNGVLSISESSVYNNPINLITAENISCYISSIYIIRTLVSKTKPHNEQLKMLRTINDIIPYPIPQYPELNYPHKLLKIIQNVKETLA